MVVVLKCICSVCILKLNNLVKILFIIYSCTKFSYTVDYQIYKTKTTISVEKSLKLWVRVLCLCGK